MFGYLGKILSRNEAFQFGLDYQEQTLGEIVGVAGFHSRLEER